MAIETTVITPTQRDILIARNEDHFFDRKSTKIRPKKLTKTISAFANTDGGELCIGLDEDSDTGQVTWRGFKDVEAANGHLQALEGLFPLGQHFSYTFLACEAEAGLVLQVEVQKTASITTDSDGTSYIRRGAQSLPVDTPEKLQQLERDKGITSFETEPVDAQIEDITNSLPTLAFVMDQVPTAEPEPWLRKQQLIRDDKPTVAGVALFAELPQAILPKRCGIKIYRYVTRDEAGARDQLAFDPIDIEGHLYSVIAEAVASTKKLIEGIRILGSTGLEQVRYPEEALHEIITNAMLHRDYSIMDDVHVRIFDNRVEIESPGLLPGHVTVDNILEERYARNGSIVRIINKFPDPPNKDVGEGLNTAFAAMQRLKLKPPEIQQTKHSVVVHLRHEPLASPEEAVMEYVAEHEEINNTTGRELTGIRSENSMKDVFKRLVARKLIEPIPGRERGPRAAYRMTERARSKSEEQEEEN